jgi:predicted molibdopterin-dependent oxidoreductase YjgC
MAAELKLNPSRVVEDKVVTTTCPYCGVGCSLELHVKDDFIFKVTSPFDSPVNHGNLCVKGRFGYDFVHSRDRLTQPLMRRDGELVAATWDQALGHVAERLLEIRDKYGPESIGFLVSAKCTNEENYLMQKVARGLIGTNNVDHCARL